MGLLTVFLVRFMFLCVLIPWYVVITMFLSTISTFLVGQLIEKEEMVVGNVKFGTYKSYISAAGGYIVCLLVLFLYSLAMGSVVFSDWWLGIWINSLEMVGIFTYIHL